MIKLLMRWDIRPGKDQEYFEFVVREFVPGITRMGLQPTEAWFTLYGNCSQVLTGGVAEDLKAMRRILASQEWQGLHSKLLDYVTNYEQKIIRATGTLQL
jgi:hypothetical protein